MELLKDIADLKNKLKKIACILHGVGLDSSTPEYADNTAALAANLSVGSIYRTGDNLKIVHA